MSHTSLRTGQIRALTVQLFQSLGGGFKPAHTALAVPTQASLAD